MKTMTCAQLGGACDTAFHAETFQDMAALSQVHARQMYAADDSEHITAMAAMGVLMQQPEALQAWMSEKQQLFDSLPNT